MEQIETFQNFIEKLVNILLDNLLQGREKSRKINSLHNQLSFKLSQDQIDIVNLVSSFSNEQLINFQTSNYNFEELNKNIIEKNKKSSKGYLLVSIVVVLGLILPFHWVFKYGFIPIDVFPKENFTFSYTYITDDDINVLINRHNNGSFFEQINIRNEYLHIKLVEKGYIISSSED